MNIKDRLKNIGFWVSILSSIVLILGAFGVEIGDEVASSVINGVCSLLVMLGIVSDPTTGTGYLDGDDVDSIMTAVKTVSAEIDKAKTSVRENPVVGAGTDQSGDESASDVKGKPVGESTDPKNNQNNSNI